jgi:hypothetical protein
MQLSVTKLLKEQPSSSPATTAFLHNIMEHSRAGSIAAQVLFLLRFIQQGSVVLTGFVAIHFIYWHNRIRDPVPVELVILVTTVRPSLKDSNLCSTHLHSSLYHSIYSVSLCRFSLITLQCSITFLENYATSAMSLYRQETKPNYSLLLKTSTPCSIAMSAGYYALRQVPFIRAWCEGDNDFLESYRFGHFGRLGVEEHMCALTCVIIAAGAVALYGHLSKIQCWC